MRSFKLIVSAAALIFGSATSYKTPIISRVGTRQQVAQKELRCGGINNKDVGKSKSKLKSVAGESDDHLSSIWDKFNKLQQSKPLLSASVTSLIVSAIGDTASQMVAGVTDLRRSCIFSMLGFFYFGPILYYWYGMIGRFGNTIETKYPNLPKLIRVIIQVAVNQSIGAIMINGGFIFSFYSLTALIRPEATFSLATAANLVSDKIANTMKANWSVWPLASFINFFFISPDARVLFTNCVAAFYNFLLSYIANQTS